MINISVNKKEDSYIPKIDFSPNASISLREMASVIYFLQSGVFAELLFEKTNDILDAKQQEELVKYITAYHTLGNLSDDKKMMENLLFAAKLPAIDSEGYTNA